MLDAGSPHGPWTQPPPSAVHFSQAALSQLCRLQQAPGTPQEAATLGEKTGETSRNPEGICLQFPHRKSQGVVLSSHYLVFIYP